jgi:hypothetical protein
MYGTSKSIVLSAVGAFALIAFESPRVKRIETVNFANLMAPADTVYIAPGKVKEFRLYGPWLDWTSKVTLLNVSQTILEKRPTFNSDGGLLRLNISAPSSASPGVTVAIVNIGCPPVPVDCAPVITFPVRIVRVGTATAITPNTNVPAGERINFTITGTNLNTATIFAFRTGLKNVTNVVPGANTLRFSALTTSCGTNRVHVRDAGEGGDFFPYPGGLDVRLDSACGVARIATGMVSGGTAPGAPDLVPVLNSTLLRHLSPIRKIASEPFCQGLFAQPTTAVVRTITVSNIVWGVRNDGASVTSPFRIRLLRNGTMVSEQVVNALNAGATFTATYARPQSQTEVARLAQVPNAVSRSTYNATGAECVQTVGQSATMDWQDPAYEVRVDPLLQVTTETNRSNNNRTY